MLLWHSIYKSTLFIFLLSVLKRYNRIRKIERICPPSHFKNFFPHLDLRLHPLRSWCLICFDRLVRFLTARMFSHIFTRNLAESVVTPGVRVSSDTCMRSDSILSGILAPAVRVCESFVLAFDPANCWLHVFACEAREAASWQDIPALSVVAVAGEQVPPWPLLLLFYLMPMSSE